MAKRPSQDAKADGSFFAFDGNPTWPADVEPVEEVKVNSTWGSVRSRQNMANGKLPEKEERTYTVEEVKSIVESAVAAALAAKEKDEKEGLKIGGK